MQLFVKKTFALAMAFAFLAGCSKKATSSANSFEKIKEKGVFVLGLDDSFPPMGFRDENGEIVGFDIDLAREVCNAWGVRLECQPINWNLKDIELSSGKIDCIWNGFTSTPEREEKMLLSKPYLNNAQVVVVRADSEIRSLADLAGKKIAIQAGSSAALAIDGMPDFKASVGQISEWPDNLTAFMDLESRGADAVVIDAVVAGYKITSGGGNFRILDENLASEQYVIAFRKEDAELLEKTQQAIETLKESGRLSEISQKWFASDICVF